MRQPAFLRKSKLPLKAGPHAGADWRLGTLRLCSGIPTDWANRQALWPGPEVLDNSQRALALQRSGSGEGWRQCPSYSRQRCSAGPQHAVEHAAQPQHRSPPRPSSAWLPAPRGSSRQTGPSPHHHRHCQSQLHSREHGDCMPPAPEVHHGFVTYMLPTQPSTPCHSGCQDLCQGTGRGGDVKESVSA